MLLINRFVMSVVACAFCVDAQAQMDAVLNADALAEVVVTSTRTAQPLAQTIGSVTVLTRADIAARQVYSLPDLLRDEVGVDISNAGGYGKQSAIFMRGTEPDHTLVLIDGVRSGSATAGTTALEYIPVDQIERIEIVRGPRSSLYGSDAIGGVIQIFTRKESGLSAQVGTGTYDTKNYSLSGGIMQQSMRVNVTANHLRSNGFNSCAGPVTAGCFAVEPDADGYRNTSVSARVAYQFGSMMDVEFSTLYAAGYSEYDGGFENQTRFRENTPHLAAHIYPLQNLQLTVGMGVNYDKSDNFYAGNYTSRFNTERRSALLQSDWQPTSQQTITVGADYLKDAVDSNTAYAVASRDNKGVFAQHQVFFGTQQILTSLRYDDNQQFGSHTTGNVGWKWTLTDALAFNAGWGKAFHAPSFNELYYPGFSNAALKPERAQSYELGVSGVAAHVQWSLQSFVTHTTDLVAFNSNFDIVNISATRLRGVEVVLRREWDAFNAGVNYTLLDARAREAGDNYNHLLSRRAKYAGHAHVNYHRGRWQLGGQINVVSARFDNIANTLRMGGYSAVDVVSEWLLGAGLSMQLKLANALDHDYELVRYYPQAGRTLFVSLRYQPE